MPASYLYTLFFYKNQKILIWGRLFLTL